MVRKYIGISLMLVGVLLLVVQHLLHFTMVNELLTIPLCLIVIGIVVYVWGLKRDSRY
ncbi:MAG: hypothetical protein J6Z14_01270 [Prevotella sp.]|nr:hypothetical protein [Prevotella sp.]